MYESVKWMFLLFLIETLDFRLFVVTINLLSFKNDRWDIRTISYSPLL